MSARVKVGCVRNGELVEVVSVEPSDARPCRLTVFRGGDGGHGVVYSGDNLFACLLALRRDLERDGLLLCCQGARRDVTSSGMQAQMAGGRYVYKFDRASRTVNEETVDILAPAGPEDVVSVEEQRAAIFDFYGIRDQSR
ncbi:hypothetical protein [Streptomyces hiroshimensis]|uniref:Uncharacterized protein n=1 Tax=Streptomyces hiroshimensis TaxID=66424 RepID=A0ABQ2Y6N3_9ACTN|nr:hypothetical protein [Streptomyces hiroshimensis]GGX68664.1 hypothetical protein GCM10010324_11830 [Streptomyces hiroshimensis]